MTSIDRRGLLKATMATLTAGKLGQAATSANKYDLGETWTVIHSQSTGWNGGVRGHDGVIYYCCDCTDDKVKRMRALDELTKQAQELDMGY